MILQLKIRTSKGLSSQKILQNFLISWWGLEKKKLSPPKKSVLFFSFRYRKQVVIDAKPALLDVLDTAGQEEYASLQDQWIREGDGYLIVYSITSKDSLEESKVMHDKISRIRDSEDFPLVLAGNKCDLVNERQVSAEEAQGCIASWNAKRKEGACKVSFFETSAKGKINTDEAFHQVVRNIRASKAQTDTGGSKKKKGFCTLL